MEFHPLDLNTLRAIMFCMVYVQAAKKTGAFMMLAMGLSLALVTFISGDLETPTGRITSTPVAEASSAGWMIFLLGVVVGAIIIGTYVYIAHLEARRES